MGGCRIGILGVSEKSRGGYRWVFGELVSVSMLLRRSVADESGRDHLVQVQVGCCAGSMLVLVVVPG